MKTVFYSVQYIAKNGGAQVAQMSCAMGTSRSGAELYEHVHECALDWYHHNGSYPLDTISVHLVALNYI